MITVKWKAIKTDLEIHESVEKVETWERWPFCHIVALENFHVIITFHFKSVFCLVVINLAASAFMQTCVPSFSFSPLRCLSSWPWGLPNIRLVSDHVLPARQADPLGQAEPETWKNSTDHSEIIKLLQSYVFRG